MKTRARKTPVQRIRPLYPGIPSQGGAQHTHATDSVSSGSSCSRIRRYNNKQVSNLLLQPPRHARDSTGHHICAQNSPNRDRAALHPSTSVCSNLPGAALHTSHAAAGTVVGPPRPAVAVSCKNPPPPKATLLPHHWGPTSTTKTAVWQTHTHTPQNTPNPVQQ